MQRRNFLKLMGAALATPYMVVGRTVQASPYAELYLNDLTGNWSTRGQPSTFPCSVASGDPCDSGVVLWTKLGTEAVTPDQPLIVQIARDPEFQQGELNLKILAKDLSADRDFTVNIDLETLLQPGTTYYYRFIYNSVVSRTGRCKTLPSADQSIDKTRFAVITCQDYTTGYYNAFSHLAQEDIDFVVHLGDFIYEYAEYAGFDNFARPLTLPSGNKVADTLEDYRFLYTTYRRDPNLQRAMEQHTFIITWDDHETADNAFWDYERDTLGLPSYDDRRNDSATGLRELRRAAQRAWIEYVPARVQVDETASHAFDYLKLYRHFRVGNLMQLFMTDSRTYRTEEPCKGGSAWENYWCYDYQNSSQTMLGHEQRNWLIDGLTQSDAKWKVWGNQTLLAQLATTVAGHQTAYANYDAWDGYQHEREMIMKAVKEAGEDKFVVLTGDMHSHIVSYLKINYRNINNWDYSNLVGVELMTPSITSPHLQDSINQASPVQTELSALLNGGVQLNNPHIKDFASSFYGYGIVELSEDELTWQVYKIDKKIDNPATPKTLYKRFTYDPSWTWIWED